MSLQVDVKTELLRQGRTMTWLAERLGLSLSVLSRRLSGTRGWQHGWMFELEKALGLPMGAFSKGKP